MVSYAMRIILLFLMFSSDVSSNHYMLRRETTKENDEVKNTYVHLLNSLVKKNEERLKALKKLYTLNSFNFGKELLRTSIENKLEEYDEIQQRVVTALKYLLSNSKHLNQNPSEEYDIFKVFPNDNYLFVLPIQKQDGIDVKKALREQVSDSRERGKKRDSSDESDSLEKLNEINVRGNQTKNRSYYYEYSCGRGRVRCIKACKEAYREACYDEYCKSGLRRSLRKGCKRECREWFY